MHENILISDKLILFLLHGNNHMWNMKHKIQKCKRGPHYEQ
jgi:hypothetical protein